MRHCNGLFGDTFSDRLWIGEERGGSGLIGENNWGMQCAGLRCIEGCVIECSCRLIIKVCLRFFPGSCARGGV